METIAPLHSAAQAEGAACHGEVRTDLTTEARWFFDGVLPEEVWVWFTGNARAGLIEQRCDPYRVGDSVDVGVKLRSGAVLERKERLREPEPFVFGDGSKGTFEIWQRWSPAVHGGEETGAACWVDVHKTICKRRFDPEGQEIRLTPDTRAMDGVGCDAEIVSLDVGGRSWWGCAFAAFGPVPDHRPLIWAAWNALRGFGSPPAALDLGRGRSVGYPEWLMQSSP